MACAIIVEDGAIIAPLGAIIVLSSSIRGHVIRARRALISWPIIVGDRAIIAHEVGYYSTICCCKRG